MLVSLAVVLGTAALTQTVGLDLSRTGPVLRQGGVKFFGHLDLLPGDYSLRVLVRNADTGRTVVTMVPVQVPAYSVDDPFLDPVCWPTCSESALLISSRPILLADFGDQAAVILESRTLIDEATQVRAREVEGYVFGSSATAHLRVARCFTPRAF